MLSYETVEPGTFCDGEPVKKRYMTMRTNIEQSPLKREIESIFNPRHIYRL